MSKDKASRDKNEYMTPELYVECVRRVLGVIEFDPASSEEAQKTVKANAYFTKEVNSLTSPWYGKVFMNPPYSGGLITTFVCKFINEFVSGNIEAGIVLVNNNSDTTWWRSLWEYCSLFANTRGRIKFIHKDLTISRPMQGQTFFLLINNKEDAITRKLQQRFHREFKSIASVSLPLRDEIVF